MTWSLETRRNSPNKKELSIKNEGILKRMPFFIDIHIPYSIYIFYLRVKLQKMSTKAERTTAYIIETVAPIFNRYGYVGTSMSHLTDATGLTILKIKKPWPFLLLSTTAKNYWPQ
jgi:hypothetical protein